MAKPIKIEILGDAKSFSAAADDVGGKLAGLGKAAAIGGAAIGAGVAGAAVGLYKLGSSFDDAYDKIAVGTGKTGEALEGLQQDFRDVAYNVPDSFDSVSTALTELNQRLGLTGPDLTAMSAQMLDLSRITETDLSTNIESVTRLFGDWSISTEDQAGYLDQLFRASQNTGVSVADLSQQMVQFGAPLRNLGFSFQESEAMLGLWSKTGVNTETVMAGLKAGVGKLAKAGENVPQTFKRVVDEITKLGPGTESTKKAIELFGQRAGPDLADAITGGKFAFDDLMHTIVEGDGTISDTAASTADFAEKWQMFQNRAKLALEPLAGAVFGALSKLFDYLSPVLKEITGGITAFQSAWKAADGDVTSSGFPGFMERLANFIQLTLLPNLKQIGEELVKLWNEKGMPVVQFFRDLAEQWFPKVVEGIQKLTDFFKQHHEALIPVAAFIGVVLVAAFLSWAASAAAAAVATIAATAPVIAIAAAIAGLVALVIYAYEHWRWFHDRVDEAGRILRDVLWPALKAVGSWMADNLIPILQSVIRVIAEWAPKVWKTFNDINSFIYWLIQKIWGIIQTVWDVGNKVYDALTSPFSRAIEWIKDAWSKLVDKVTHPISIPNPFSAIGKAAGGLFGRAYGGPVGQGGVFNVGEFGRTETVYLPKGSRVERGSSGGHQINVYASTNASARDIGNELSWALRTSGV